MTKIVAKMIKFLKYILKTDSEDCVRSSSNSVIIIGITNNPQTRSISNKILPVWYWLIYSTSLLIFQLPHFLFTVTVSTITRLTYWKTRHQDKRIISKILTIVAPKSRTNSGLTGKSCRSAWKIRNTIATASTQTIQKHKRIRNIVLTTFQVKS